jgi:hypothetical protein
MRQPGTVNISARRSSKQQFRALPVRRPPASLARMRSVVTIARVTAAGAAQRVTRAKTIVFDAHQAPRFRRLQRLANGAAVRQHIEHISYMLPSC